MALSRKCRIALSLSTAFMLASCTPEISAADVKAAEAIAIRFADALSKRNYSGAYGLTTEKYRREMPFASFEKKANWMLPPQFGSPTKVELLEAHDMREARTYEDGDIRWAYLWVQSSTMGEAVSVVVKKEGEVFRIRAVEWGRP